MRRGIRGDGRVAVDREAALEVASGTRAPSPSRAPCGRPASCRAACCRSLRWRRATTCVTTPLVDDEEHLPRLVDLDVVAAVAARAESRHVRAGARASPRPARFAAGRSPSGRRAPPRRCPGRRRRRRRGARSGAAASRRSSASTLGPRDAEGERRLDDLRGERPADARVARRAARVVSSTRIVPGARRRDPARPAADEPAVAEDAHADRSGACRNEPSGGASACRRPRRPPAGSAWSCGRSTIVRAGERAPPKRTWYGPGRTEEDAGSEAAARDRRSPR